jgi:hypothetical protein
MLVKTRFIDEPSLPFWGKLEQKKQTDTDADDALCGLTTDH